MTPAPTPPHEKFAPTMRKGERGWGGGGNHGPMVAKLSPVSGNIVNKGGGGMGHWRRGPGVSFTKFSEAPPRSLFEGVKPGDYSESVNT